MGAFNRRVECYDSMNRRKKKGSRTKEIEDLHLNDIHARRGRIGEQKDAITDP